MRLLDPSLSPLLLALLTLSPPALAARPKDAILLSEVHTYIFYLPSSISAQLNTLWSH
jgi:hypothetical protein